MIIISKEISDCSKVNMFFNKLFSIRYTPKGGYLSPVRIK